MCYVIVQGRVLAVRPARARKQTEKQDVGVDLPADALPADLQKLSKLAKVCYGTAKWCSETAGGMVACAGVSNSCYCCCCSSACTFPCSTFSDNKSCCCLQTELQHQLEVRGLDKNGNKEELANRLLDNLINQVNCLVLRCNSHRCC